MLHNMRGGYITHVQAHALSALLQNAWATSSLNSTNPKFITTSVFCYVFMGCQATDLAVLKFYSYGFHTFRCPYTVTRIGAYGASEQQPKPAGHRIPRGSAGKAAESL
jgi:hypothetical protein